MRSTNAPIEWRAGYRRLFGVLALHALAATAAVAIAVRWPLGWALLVGVTVDALFDVRRAWCDAGRLRRLHCTPFGVALDGRDCEVRDAWLALGWTALRLREPGARAYWVYVHERESTAAEIAALRRHVKSLAYA